MADITGAELVQQNVQNGTTQLAQYVKMCTKSRCAFIHNKQIIKSTNVTMV